MVYMHQSLGGACSGAPWTVEVSWSQRSLGIVRLLCSDTVHVSGCWLGLASPKWTFWSLLGCEGGWILGLTLGPGGF